MFPVRSIQNGCLFLYSILMVGLLCATSGPSVVFIHLGDTVPDYLFDAVDQARKFNDEEVRVIVLTDQAALNKLETTKLAKASFIASETLIRSEAHNLFLKTSSLDRNSRGGFWIKATERFFYLDELMRQYNLHDVVHMEYDNMLYVNVMELLPMFHRYANIAATFDADSRCIAGLIYLARPESLHVLVSFLAAMASRGVFEMQAIALFKQSHGAHDIDNLPIVTSEYVREYGLRSTCGLTTTVPDNYVRYVDEFNSIFDAAAWGQFLGGIDPRNGHSVPGFINETCLFNPSKIEFSWELDQQGRKVPYVYAGEKRYRINNLHIHSKNLKAFAS